MREKTVKVNLKDLYQFLISACRYGYTRNNHLMPDGAYDHVKEYITKIAKCDKDYAISTVKQLCEECISNQLITNFYDGEDDEFGNRKEAIDFINWCIDYVNVREKYWQPYNFDRFKENCDKDFEPRYKVYEVINDEKILLTEDIFSEDTYLTFIFDYLNIIGCSYTKQAFKVSEDFNDRRRNYFYHIMSPVQKDFYVEHI